MKSFKIKSCAILVLIALCFSTLAPVMVSAASEPFQTLDEAAGGKNVLKTPVYIDGGKGFNDAEGAASLLDYKNENAKYCTDKLPYFAEWKYNRAAVVDGILLRTGGDNSKYPRRMGDGWTLSGSDDGKTWTVIYTGKEGDVENLDNTYYYVDLPENKTAYKFYKLFSESAASDQTNNVIQLSMFVLCGTETPLQTGAGVTVIEATDFDSGKYYESNAADGSHGVRTAEEVQTEFCGDSYVGRTGVNGKTTGNIGWTAAKEWVQYTVNITKSGIYQLDAWIASGTDAAGAVEVYCGEELIGSAQSTNKGWQNYSKVSVGEFQIEAGIYVFKALFPTGGINFNALEFNRTGDLPVLFQELTEEPEKMHKIVSLGDSIAAHYGLPEEQGYVSQLSNLLESKNINNEIINLAKSGATTYDLLALLETDKAKDALKDADAVMVSIGGNNILAPILNYAFDITTMINHKYFTGTPSQNNIYFNATSYQYADLSDPYYASLSMSAIEKAFDYAMNEETMTVVGLAIGLFALELQEIVIKINELAPEACIYINTIYDPVDKDLSIYEKINPILEELNAIIIAGAQNDAYRVINVASAFAASEKNLTGFDLVRRMYNIHPNKSGHITIAELYLDAMTGKYVKPVFEVPSEVPAPVAEVADSGK